MRTIIVTAGAAMILALFGTPLAIRLFRSRGYGQLIREEGPKAHATKRGTPTMGGTVIVIASLIGYVVGHWATGDPMRASGVLVLGLMTGLGLVGFVDDFIKIYRQTSLGLRSGAKLAGQSVVGAIFAVLVLRYPDGYGITPADPSLSFLRDFGPALGVLPFVIWIVIMIGGASNAVNLTDGLDGLATGAAILVLAAYVLIANWQLRNDCTVQLAKNCYIVRDPLDLAVVAAAVLGACFGFLWWNAPPARIFMGDTGSLALGGVLAGLAVVHRHPAAAGHPRRPVRDHHGVGDDPGRLVQADPPAGVQDGAPAAPLRADRLGRDHDRDQVLADRRAVRRARAGHLLHRMAAVVVSGAAAAGFAAELAGRRVCVAGLGVSGPPAARVLAGARRDRHRGGLAGRRRSAARSPPTWPASA